MIAIVDYEGGNLASVLRALEYLKHDAVITADPDTIRGADHVIFPGVGSAQAAMRIVRERGFDTLLRTDVLEAGTPLLGICIGVQIIFEHSEEEDTECLGFVEGSVRKFPAGELKVPQIGWNQVEFIKEHPIFEGVESGRSFYFVNSYRPVPTSDDVVYAKTEYGVEFASVIAKDSLVATQFHLEKSGKTGLKMLDNFCRWDGTL